ncbi:MAG: DUF188 domain-containing protein [Treponemataceae bacterium]|nr:MAG: DUF188 domain-containing protein [Treponemataceae bacterium]
MIIWLDADSCPLEARRMLERFALRLSIPLKYAANRNIPFAHEENALFEMHITTDDPNAADDFIVENACAQSGDIAVTRDIPLAKRLLEKNITVLNDRGIFFTPENIAERLSLRDFNKDIFDFGLAEAKTKTYDKRDLNNFANALDRAITMQKKRSVSEAKIETSSNAGRKKRGEKKDGNKVAIVVA